MRASRTFLTVAAFLLIVGQLSGCGTKEDKTAAAKPVMAPAPVLDMASGMQPPAASGAAPAAEPKKEAAAPGIAVEVDGAKLTRAELEAELEKKMAAFKSQIPSERLDQAKIEIRRGIVDEFIARTLLTREIDAKKVTAGEKEIGDVLDAMKAQLPPGTTMEEMLKKNKIDPVKIREEIGMNIRVKKLISQELGGKAKVADKEVADFYNKNLDKFKKPEAVHARHLLVSKGSGDTDKIKAEKRAKAETLRKQLADGADFAELAKKNSDCPSKENGGDLGTFSRGQMVKPFEDAAFAQEKNAIGPVVETDFGFHIIQVLEKQASQTAKLDAELKKQIQTFLERQKQEAAFEAMIKRLKAGANIVVYGK